MAAKVNSRQPTTPPATANGVKNVKALLKKCHDGKECFETALAEFRIAPREDGYSPAELFYRRQVRGLLPELPSKLNVEKAEQARDRVQEAATTQRQTRSASKPLVMAKGYGCKTRAPKGGPLVVQSKASETMGKAMWWRPTQAPICATGATSKLQAQG